MTDFVREFCASAGLPWTEEISEKLDSYADFLTEYNKNVNLTAITEPEAIRIRHFTDSLTLAAATRISGSLIDVGTGAGFPGVVMKLFYPSLSLTLLDSNGKKATFLKALCAHLGIEAEILNMRAEVASNMPDYREKFKVATARAVADMSTLCEYCLPFVKVGGMFAAMKGGSCEGEIVAARTAVETLGGQIRGIKLFTLPDGSSRWIILAKKISHTPTQYPRPSAKIAKKPL